WTAIYLDLSHLQIWDQRNHPTVLPKRERPMQALLVRHKHLMILDFLDLTSLSAIRIWKNARFGQKKNLRSIRREVTEGSWTSLIIDVGEN
ncbi:hypothetical protein A2U01_0052843, partial [Trifolium medium]|nr:hypothetical protein [Trifolium medium]